MSLAAAGYALLGSAYVCALTAASARHRVVLPGPRRRFAIVVPAHDEEAGIAHTVDSLRALDYPEDDRRVLVVADNCVDRTAAVARAHGAEVLTRVDEHNRGKGFALRAAFDHLLAEGTVDAVVVVDADTVVAPDLLRVCAAELGHGADVLQVDYQVRNPALSWRTRLLDVAFTCNHRVRSCGRRRLGLSAGLHGNGMVFTAEALRDVPYGALSAVEDLEYGIQLGMAGKRVTFVSETYVRGDMPAGGRGAETQRVRWEAGRAEIRRRYLRPLLRSTVQRRDPVLADLAVDLLVPPLGTIVGVLALATATALPAPAAARRLALGAVTIGVAALAAHVATGVVRSQSRLAALPAMAKVPAYAIWKARVAILARLRRPAGDVNWVRTTRSYEQSESEAAQ